MHYYYIAVEFGLSIVTILTLLIIIKLVFDIPLKGNSVTLYTILLGTIATISMELIDYLRIIPKHIYIFTSFLIFFMLIVTIINASTLFKLESQKYELEYQKFYNKILEAFISDLRKFKHKYNNDMSVLGAYINLNRWEELKKYYAELVAESNAAIELNSITLLNIKNVGILGLFSSKFEYAGKKGVTLKIDVQDELKEINMKMSRLCEILGVLLDNAIEAAEESEKKIAKVKIVNTNHEIIFCIENSISGEIPIEDLFKKGYSTKGAGRGLGLWVVKGIINNSKNVLLNTSFHESLFRQELIVLHD